VVRCAATADRQELQNFREDTAAEEEVKEAEEDKIKY
jgi:hypothetical protein